MIDQAAQDQLLAAIDGSVDDQVIVLSPPPPGRAPRLLVHDRNRDAIERLLRQSGYVPHGHRWAKFRGSSFSGVELVPLGDWWPAVLSTEELFDPADTIGTYRHLVVPRPAGMLLLASREFVLRRGSLPGELDATVRSALEREPGAWRQAEALARRSGLSGAVRLLRRAHEEDAPLPAGARVRGLAEVFLAPASATGRWSLLRESFLVPRRSTMVSFSGLDGAGKTTQLTHLRAVFDFFGMPTGFDHAVFANGWRLHFLCRLLGRLSSAGGPSDAAHDPHMPVECQSTPRRQRSWALTVALVNVGKSWLRTIAYRSSGRVVLIDRFTPDSAVKIDFHYQERWSLDVRLPRAVFTRTAAKPDVGFLMAVPGPVAHARRGEWEPEELDVMARSYEEQVDRFGLLRLDGTQPVEVLQERVASTTWRRLR